MSSVWNRDVKQHGRAFLFDDQEDTAWSSEPVIKPEIKKEKNLKMSNPNLELTPMDSSVI